MTKACDHLHSHRKGIWQNPAPSHDKNSQELETEWSPHNLI